MHLCGTMQLIMACHELRTDAQEEGHPPYCDPIYHVGHCQPVSHTVSQQAQNAWSFFTQDPFAHLAVWQESLFWAGPNT